jgi:hypothetical protein
MHANHTSWLMSQPCGLSSPIIIMHTPGHTRDSLCLIMHEKLFTGDTLFLDDGGAGRDDPPGGEAGEHWESMERLRMLPDRLEDVRLSNRALEIFFKINEMQSREGLQGLLSQFQRYVEGDRHVIIKREAFAIIDA